MMKKTILLCLLMAAVGLSQAQNVKVNVSGTAAEKTRMVYLYDDMQMQKAIDSIATRNGKWTFNQERPLNSLLLAFNGQTADRLLAREHRSFLRR